MSLLRIPSPADAFVPHQDPQNDGQTPAEPHTLAASARTHQELPASPELRAILLLSSVRPLSHSIEGFVNPVSSFFNPEPVVLSTVIKLLLFIVVIIY